jgi:hypothetical protein
MIKIVVFIDWLIYYYICIMLPVYICIYIYIIPGAIGIYRWQEKIYTYSNSQPWLMCSGLRHILRRVCKNCWKSLLDSCLFICLFVCPYGTTRLPLGGGGIFMKFEVRWFFRNSVEQIQVSLHSAKNNGYFTWRTTYIHDHSWKITNLMHQFPFNIFIYFQLSTCFEHYALIIRRGQIVLTQLLVIVTLWTCTF